jgi:hypothetical protein
VFVQRGLKPKVRKRRIVPITQARRVIGNGHVQPELTTNSASRSVPRPPCPCFTIGRSGSYSGHDGLAIQLQLGGGNRRQGAMPKYSATPERHLCKTYDWRFITQKTNTSLAAGCARAVAVPGSRRIDRERRAFLIVGRASFRRTAPAF